MLIDQKSYDALYYKSLSFYVATNIYFLGSSLLLSQMPSDEENPYSSATIKASAGTFFLWQLSSVIFDQVKGVTSSENGLFNTVYNQLTGASTPSAQMHPKEDPIIQSYLDALTSLSKINFPDRLIPEDYIPAIYKKDGEQPTREQEELYQQSFTQYAGFVVQEVNKIKQATSSKLAQFFTSCELTPTQYELCHNAAINRMEQSARQESTPR